MHTDKTASHIAFDTDLPLFEHKWPQWVSVLGPCGNVKSSKGVDLVHLPAGWLHHGKISYP